MPTVHRIAKTGEMQILRKTQVRRMQMTFSQRTRKQ